MKQASKISKIKDQRSNNSNYDLEERTAVFGESVISFCLSLRLNSVSRPLVSQLIRSATSIGANYHEANNASSRKDFRNKVYISKKEASETKYWLRMLLVTHPDKTDNLNDLQKETQELLLILQSIINKVKEDV